MRKKLAFKSLAPGTYLLCSLKKSNIKPLVHTKVIRQQWSYSNSVEGSYVRKDLLEELSFHEAEKCRASPL